MVCSSFEKKKLGFVLKKSEKKKWKKKEEVLQQNYRCAIVGSQAIEYKCQQLKKNPGRRFWGCEG